MHNWLRILTVLCIAHCALCIENASAQERDDFGVWGELSVTKRLPYNLSVGLEAEVRSKDNVQQMDRWNVGLNMGYKPLKWLKLSAGYTFVEGYKGESTKIKYKSSGKLDTYKVTEAYHTPKHRIVAMATLTSPKLWKWVRVSLRERYQFTWRNEQTVNRLKYKANEVSANDAYDLDLDGRYYKFMEGYPVSDPDVKLARQRHSLRSRLKVEMDKKRIDWHPFVAYEIYNDLKDGFNLTDWRIAAGTSWDVAKNHSISAAYIYNVERDVDGNGHQHVVSIGYEFKF